MLMMMTLSKASQKSAVKDRLQRRPQSMIAYRSIFECMTVRMPARRQDVVCPRCMRRIAVYSIAHRGRSAALSRPAGKERLMSRKEQFFGRKSLDISCKIHYLTNYPTAGYRVLKTKKRHMAMNLPCTTASFPDPDFIVGLRGITKTPCSKLQGILKLNLIFSAYFKNGGGGAYFESSETGGLVMELFDRQRVNSAETGATKRYRRQ